MKENDTEKLSNSMFLNVITSFFSDFPKMTPRGVARFYQFRVALAVAFMLKSVNNRLHENESTKAVAS